MKDTLQVGSTYYQDDLVLDGISLRHYSSTSSALSRPLLVIPSIINKNYILDLLPDHSLIEFLVNQKIDVYMIDWGTKIESDPLINFEQLAMAYIDQFVDHLRTKTNFLKVSILGHCLGGTLGLIYASYMSHKIEILQLLTAPADFEQAGILGQWAKNTPINLNLFSQGFEKAPAWLLQTVFQLARPTSMVFKIQKLASKLNDHDFIRFFLALEYWGWDVANLGPALYRDLIQNLYRDNQLINGNYLIKNQFCDLSNIQCQISIVAVEDDHIVPLSAQLKSYHVPNANYRIQILRGGHIGGTLGSYAQKNHWQGWAQQHLKQEPALCHTFL